MGQETDPGRISIVYFVFRRPRKVSTVSAFHRLLCFRVVFKKPLQYMEPWLVSNVFGLQNNAGSLGCNDAVFRLPNDVLMYLCDRMSSSGQAFF